MQYYTPSGRLIQRDYSNISFLDYYYHNNLDQKNTADVKMTDSGRTVYGGGGITPDEKYAPPKLNKFQIDVCSASTRSSTSPPSSSARARYASCPRAGRLTISWSNEFHEFLLKNKFEFTEAEFTENHQWIKDQLKREMYITAFSYEESAARSHRAGSGRAEGHRSPAEGEGAARDREKADGADA